MWGLHDYYDTTYFRASGLEDFMRAVSGEVWLTETGGIVGLRTRDGQVSLPRDELRARASVAYAFELARAFPDRVARMYLYQWQTDPEGRFDAGLVRPDGSARPALTVVRAQLAALGDPLPAAAGAPPTAAPGSVTIAPVGRRHRARALRNRHTLRRSALDRGRPPRHGDARQRAVARRRPAAAVALGSRWLDGRVARLRFAVSRSVLVRALGAASDSACA